MKTSRLTFALIGAVIVAAMIAVANVRANISVDSLTGYGLAAGLVCLVALEYGVGSRRPLRR